MFAAAGKYVGYGHLKRAVAIAKEMRISGTDVRFLLECDNASVADTIRAESFSCRCLPLGRPASEVLQFIFSETKSGDIVVIDISHSLRLADRRDTIALWEVLRGADRYTAVFDGGPEHRLFNNSEDHPDLLILPYVGETWASGRNIINGPDFFIFDETYSAAARIEREIRRHADRVLVTFGGSDPTRLTLDAIEALHATLPQFTVRIVVGPGFSSSYKREIKMKISAPSQHAFSIVAAPESLAAHMLWCDFAISGTGLTKYELAVTGTPSVQVSVDPGHAAVNRPFADAGTAVDLGVADDMTVPELASAIRRLRDDAEMRRTLSAAGKRLLDGKGTRRVVDRILGNAAQNAGTRK